MYSKLADHSSVIRVKLNENALCRDTEEVACSINIDTVWIRCRYEYHWCDGVNYKKPAKLPASQYISLLMDWVEQQINNEDLFPVTVGLCFIVLEAYLIYKKLLKSGFASAVFFITLYKS